MHLAAKKCTFASNHLRQASNFGSSWNAPATTGTTQARGSRGSGKGGPGHVLHLIDLGLQVGQLVVGGVVVVLHALLQHLLRVVEVPHRWQGIHQDACADFFTEQSPGQALRLSFEVGSLGSQL